MDRVIRLEPTISKAIFLQKAEEVIVIVITIVFLLQGRSVFEVLDVGQDLPYSSIFFHIVPKVLNLIR